MAKPTNKQFENLPSASLQQTRNQRNVTSEWKTICQNCKESKGQELQLLPDKDVATKKDRREEQQLLLAERPCLGWSLCIDSHIKSINANMSSWLKMENFFRFKESSSSAEEPMLRINDDQESLLCEDVILLNDYDDVGNPSIEPANVAEALKDADWVSAMQDELDQFARLKVWRLVPRPEGKTIIKTKWIFKNKKKMKSHLVIRNKAACRCRILVNKTAF
ncbi:retrovirus-related pol polyprotein from transposon TNT 1-94 [Tanacetum coccineum]